MKTIGCIGAPYVYAWNKSGLRFLGQQEWGRDGVSLGIEFADGSSYWAAAHCLADCFKTLWDYVLDHVDQETSMKIMGYPSEWTVCEPWAMPLSRRRPAKPSSVCLESKKDKHGTVSPNQD